MLNCKYKHAQLSQLYLTNLINLTNNLSKLFYSKEFKICKNYKIFFQLNEQLNINLEMLILFYARKDFTLGASGNSEIMRYSPTFVPMHIYIFLHRFLSGHKK